MINRLVINGCSYMNYYHQGGGTQDLADRLGLSECLSLAKNSICNSRILRTTLRDMYSTHTPTLYVLGTTFINRYELTLLEQPDFDGTWVSCNGQPVNHLPTIYKKVATLASINSFAKSHVDLMNGKDLLEDLMYRLLCLIDAAKNKSHRMLIFNTAEHAVDYYLDESRYDLLKQPVEVIGGFHWRSIPWQFEQGATYPPEDEQYPADCRHVSPGQHRWLNEFLTNYIQEHKILQ